MATDWRQVLVADVASKAKNALVGGPFGSNLVSRDYMDFGVPVIRGQNMGDRWVCGDLVFVSEEKAAALSANLTRPGDIVFTQRGTLGQVSMVPPQPYDRYLLSQSQMKLTVATDVADPLFLYYVFSSPQQKEYIRQNAIQTGVPHTNLGILRETPIGLPPLSEQHAIAAILGALDDKIELNRRMNHTLEQIARAIFQSWFLDFDPVWAKKEGRQPTGMDAETAALFPDDFDESELRLVPKGWSVGPLYHLIDVIYGAPFASKLFNESGDGLPLLRIRDLESQEPSIYTTENLDRGALVRPGNIVAGMDGEFRAHLWAGPTSWMNQRVCMFHPREGVPRHFVLQSVEGHLAVLERSKVGTTVIHLGKADLDRVRLLVPHKAVLRRYGDVTEPLANRMVATGAESRTLAAIRDTLLPKLISGEIRIKDAEKIVGEAV